MVKFSGSGPSGSSGSSGSSAEVNSECNSNHCDDHSPEQNTLESVLKDLSSLQDDEIKLRVEEDDILADVIGYFKGNKYKDKNRIIIRMNNKPAVDTGGVLRHVFTTCFLQMTEGIGGAPQIFEGRIAVSFSASMFLEYKKAETSFLLTSAKSVQLDHKIPSNLSVL